ncbi:toll/interleukin-1 receptor domain-containing protein [Colwellia psychrerythraea]|uniref:TIR protein n=1 Tax=Colwellia psychrerythraea TaxID=28229 RepID=A0A099KD41_COLPS|nr:toll/interleukin-1 receptor domain-containing protein [Colwellia psychrerythraea]KGJ87957.1 TIR protein [Colwellia psychrerythraea]
MKVFLGGTVNGSSWRSYVIPRLNIAYFNPVVKVWSEAALDRELYERRHSDFCLYVITPKLTGFYALAEVIDDSIKRPDRTIYCFLSEDGGDTFSDNDCKILTTIGEQVAGNGGYNCRSLDGVVNLLNNDQRKKSFENSPVIDKHHDVYISYGRNDSKTLAKHVSDSLTKKHYSVWYDNAAIPQEIAFLAQINQIIRQCHCFIFIFSAHAAHSEYCLRELEFARLLGKNIIFLFEHALPVEQQIEQATETSLFVDMNASFHIDLTKDANLNAVITYLSTSLEHLTPHTQWLNKTHHWQESQQDDDLLLYGRQRISACKWLSTEVDGLGADLYSVSDNVRGYINKSAEQAFSKRCLYYFNQWLSPVIHHKRFDAFIGSSSIANPLALLPQLWVLFMATSAEAIAISMWFLFLSLQVCGALFAVKHRNFMMCISQFVSMVITCSIIILAFVKQ